MLKFVDVKEVFAEIPDEITLAISISGCPIQCKGCHSRYLWEDVGEELTTEALSALLRKHFGVSCVCFMGGDQAPEEVNRLARRVRENSTVSVAWYSGRERLHEAIALENFDYVKLGHYDEEHGPLNNPATNQRLWQVVHAGGSHTLTDITHRFWK